MMTVMIVLPLPDDDCQIEDGDNYDDDDDDDDNGRNTKFHCAYCSSMSKLIHGQ